MNNISIEKGIYSLLKLSCNSNEDLDNICIQIQNYIDNGAIIHHKFLWEALRLRCPIEIISFLYNKNKKAVYASDGKYTIFNLPDTRNITVEYNFEFFLSLWFGDYFRFMLDEQIEYIEYILKCLEIFQIKESDIDWDLCLKYGYLY